MRRRDRPRPRCRNKESQSITVDSSRWTQTLGISVRGLRAGATLAKMNHAEDSQAGGPEGPLADWRDATDFRRSLESDDGLGAGVRRHLPLPIPRVSRLLPEPARIHRASSGEAPAEVHEGPGASSKPRAFRQRAAHERGRFLAEAEEAQPAGVSSRADPELREDDGGV